MASINDASICNKTYTSEDDHEHKRDHVALILDRYKDRFATCPKEKGWVSENLYLYQGFWHISNYGFSVQTIMALQDTFKAHPTDIYLITLPKSGTTWMKALMFAIVNRAKYKGNPLSSHPLLINNPHKCVRFLETEMSGNTTTYVDDACAPRLFATHIPHISLPQSILDSGCRIVYMSRNPKDVLVSLFHFTNKLRDESCDRLSFEEAFEMFTKGASPYGPYWDHVKGYYNMSLEYSANLLFLTYEDMKEDTVNNVKHLAKFLGYPFSNDEEASGVVDEIVRLCSFKTLNEANKHRNSREIVPNDAFFRKGKVGDWKNHFTDEMTTILNNVTREKFYGHPISQMKLRF